MCFEGFAASSIDQRFVVCCVREDVVKLRNSMYEQIKERFDAEDVEIPFPHISIYKGSATEPHPIQIASDSNK